MAYRLRGCSGRRFIAVLSIATVGVAVGACGSAGSSTSTTTVPTKRPGVAKLATKKTAPIGSSCSLSAGSPSLTLSDMSPAPGVTVPVGARIVVSIPSAAQAGPEEDTDVHIVNDLAVKEECSVSLPNHGRRTILLAISPGTSGLSATITPSTDTAMPEWLGTVDVTDSALEGMTLGPDGLGIVTVGDSQESVMTIMTKALGAPTATVGGGCLDRIEVHWGDLSLEFHSGTLDGYRYLNGAQTLMGSKAPIPMPNTPLLRTATGATLGMPLAKVRALYPPDAFSLEHDGSISLAGTTPGDRLLLSFFATNPTTPLWEIKGGAPCGDF
jgi:hypothetical protein